MYIHFIVPTLPEISKAKLTISYEGNKIKFNYDSNIIKFNKQIISFGDLLKITNERVIDPEEISINQLGFIGFDSINYINTFNSKETLTNSFEHLFNSSRYYENTFLVFRSQENLYILLRSSINLIKIDMDSLNSNSNIIIHEFNQDDNKGFLDILKNIMQEDEFTSLTQSYSELNLQAALQSKVTGNTVLKANEIQLDLLTLLVSYIFEANPSLKANLLQKYPEIEDMLSMVTSNYIFNIESKDTCLENLKDRDTARKYLDAYYRDAQSLKNV